MAAPVPADALLGTFVDIDTCSAVRSGAVSCLAYTLEGTFAVHAATTLTNALVSTFVDICAVAPSSDGEARLTLALIRPRSIAAPAAAADARVVTALVHVTTRVACLGRLVARVAHAFKSSIAISAYSIGAHASVCRFTFVFVTASKSTLNRIKSRRTSALESTRFVDTSTAFTILESAFVDINTGRVTILHY